MPKPDLYALAAELHECGLTQGMTARVLGYSRERIAQVHRELGIAGPRRYRTAAEAYKALPPDVQAKVLAVRKS